LLRDRASWGASPRPALFKVGAQSDARGHYRLVLPDTGSVTLMALGLGYDRQVLSVTGTGGRVDTLHFRLRKLPRGSVIIQH